MTTISPPSRLPSAHVYYSMTKSLCGICKAAVDAKIVFRDDAVYFLKFCPEHGRQECLAASSVEWYLDCLSFVAPNTPPKRISKEVEHGCPFDCGACASHQRARLDSSAQRSRPPNTKWRQRACSGTFRSG